MSALNLENIDYKSVHTPRIRKEPHTGRATGPWTAPAYGFLVQDASPHCHGACTATGRIPD